MNPAKNYFILCTVYENSDTDKNWVGSAKIARVLTPYPVMDHSFECVLELLAQPVGLEDVDYAHEQQEAFTLVVARRNPTRTEQQNIS